MTYGDLAINYGPEMLIVLNLSFNQAPGQDGPEWQCRASSPPMGLEQQTEGAPGAHVWQRRALELSDSSESQPLDLLLGIEMHITGSL